MFVTEDVVDQIVDIFQFVSSDNEDSVVHQTNPHFWFDQYIGQSGHPSFIFTSIDIS